MTSGGFFYMTINYGYCEGCPCYVVHKVTCKEDDSFSWDSMFDVDDLFICWTLLPIQQRYKA